MITESLTSNEINLTFIPTSKSDLLNEIENIVKKCLSNVQPEPETNFITINEFCKISPKKPTKNTVYSHLSKKKIPT